MPADYGQAIRVMHHGCERAIEIAGGLEDDRLRGVALGVAYGYAFSLQVMTRRPAIDHLSRALRVVGEREGDDDPEAFTVAVEGGAVLLAKIGTPHEDWEREHG